MPALAPACLQTVASALPLPTPGWDSQLALEALEVARDQLPVPLPPHATVVSALTTVVLHAGSYAVKVYPPGTSTEHLNELADRLSASSTAHAHFGTAVDTAHGVVTVAGWLPGADSVTWPETGALLARFHSEHHSTTLPRWTPLSRLASQLPHLRPDDAAILAEARTELLGALSQVRSELGEGVIHGDVSPSNVMRGPRGPVLIDMDWAAVAPREYDLAGAARRARSGEMARHTYRAFCAAYGHDVTSWDGLLVLDRIAELGGVIFRLWDDRHHGRDLGWVPAEVRRWRTAL